MKSNLAAVSYTLSCGWKVDRNAVVELCCCCCCCCCFCWASVWYHPPVLALDTIDDSAGIGPGTTGAKDAGCERAERAEDGGGGTVTGCCGFGGGDVDRRYWLTPNWRNAPSTRTNLFGGAEGGGLSAPALGVRSPSPEDVPGQCIKRMYYGILYRYNSAK